MYPKGFVPFINGDVEDSFVTVGYKNQFGDWNADISQTYGYNTLAHNIGHTLNASIANKELLGGGKGISATAFNAGGFSFGQMTTNADVSRFFPNIASGMNVAFGAEYRRENYQIFAGELGTCNDADGVGLGGNAGSQGFPGYQPSDAANKIATAWQPM